jgi:hypothetical protein
MALNVVLKGKERVVKTFFDEYHSGLSPGTLILARNEGKYFPIFYGEGLPRVHEKIDSFYRVTIPIRTVAEVSAKYLKRRGLTLEVRTFGKHSEIQNSLVSILEEVVPDGPAVIEMKGNLAVSRETNNSSERRERKDESTKNNRTGKEQTTTYTLLTKELFAGDKARSELLELLRGKLPENLRTAYQDA